MAAVVLVAVALRTAQGPQAIGWALVAVLFASALPMAYVLVQVRRRLLADHRVSVRAQRRLPILVGIVSTFAGVGILVALRAPRPLIALLAAGVTGLGVAFGITLVWKLSLHTATLAGAVTIVVIVFGPSLLALAPLVALVGWARVMSGEHTPAQVLAGAAIGCVIAAVVFPAAR